MNRVIQVYYHTRDKTIQEIRKKYNNHLYAFHSRYTKLSITIDKLYKTLEIYLVGFDKTRKKKYTTFLPKKIIKDIDNMPLGKIQKKDMKSLSLYANYHPTTSLQGLGYKDKQKAKDTIRIIQNKPYTYQIQVLHTMIYRAKYHPYSNENMKEAIQVFEEYKKKLQKKYKN